MVHRNPSRDVMGIVPLATGMLTHYWWWQQDSEFR